MNASYLVNMTEDELDDYVGWIDHRSEEEEVVAAVQEHTGEPLDCYWDGEEFFVTLGRSKYRIPVSLSQVDRYVAISSLAEILKEKYRFLLRSGYDGSDTHGLLVVPMEVARELKEKHGEWLNDNFEALQIGVDHFSGLTIPYYGKEEHNPKLKEKLAEVKSAEIKLLDIMRNSPEMERIGRQLRIKLGTATTKDKVIHYGPRFGLLVLALALLWLGQVAD